MLFLERRSQRDTRGRSRVHHRKIPAETGPTEARRNTTAPRIGSEAHPCVWSTDVLVLPLARTCAHVSMARTTPMGEKTVAGSMLSSRIPDSDRRRKGLLATRQLSKSFTQLVVSHRSAVL